MLKGLPSWLPIAALGAAVFVQFFARWIWIPWRRVVHVRGAAARLGLKFSQSTINFITPIASVTGQVQGRDVWFWLYPCVSGKSRADHCAVVVRPTEHGVEFRLSPQGFGSWFAAAAGAKEITIGDPVFDRAWFIQTDRPEYLTAALGPEIRARLMASLEAGCRGTFHAEPGKVYYAERGTLFRRAQVARLESQVPLLLDLASIVEASAQR